MQSPDSRVRAPDDVTFRAALQAVVRRSGRSMRSLSLAMGRDPGYVAALLDPSRPSRARPTPIDLLALSDATGIPFVELLERLWGIPNSRLANELGPHDPAAAPPVPPGDEAIMAEFARFLASRAGASPRRGARERGE